MTKDIYRHIYDNPKNADGTEKPNELLGSFEILHGDDDEYSFEIIGRKGGKLYKIVGREVSGMYGNPAAGTICMVNRIEWLDHYLREVVDSVMADPMPVVGGDEDHYYQRLIWIRGLRAGLLREFGLVPAQPETQHEYQDAFDDTMGRPMEALDKMTTVEGGTEAHE